MKNISFFLACILIAVIDFKLVHCSVNITEYNRIPKLYKLDDYEKCFEEFPNKKSTYCFVDITIKPDNQSNEWNYIEKITQDKRHYFRHDRLRRGLCLNWCIERLAHLDQETQREYFQPIFERNLKEITFDPANFRNALEYRKKYGELMNECVNLELKDEYDLMAYSEIEYCETNQDPFEMDSLDISFLIVVMLLILAIGGSTLFDFYMKQTAPTAKSVDHYKVAPQGVLKRLLISFSLKRNWYKLTTDSGPEEIKPLHALKFALECFLIVVHTLFVFNIFPQENPQFMEGMYQNFISVFITNGLLIIQTYFVISGFILAYTFYQSTDQQYSFRASFFWKKLIGRYFQIVPTYAFVILFHATWLSLLQNGPVANHFNEPERTFCRKNWWVNLLFINSYYRIEQPCVQQGWFMGSDFILYTVSLMILMLIWRFPKLSTFFVVSSVVLAFGIPGYLTYAMGFDGIIMLYPESQKYVLWYNEMYRYIYIPSHTNISGFMCGIFGGYWLFYMKREDINMKQHKWFNILWWAIIPVAFGTLISGYIFYVFDFVKPAVWISIYASVSRNLWSAAMAIVIVGLASGVGWVVRNIANYKIFHSLGRLSLCVYLIHTFVLRATFGSMRQPSYMSMINITVGVFSTIVLSYIAAFILWTAVEKPFNNIIETIFGNNENVEMESTQVNTERDRINGGKQIEQDVVIVSGFHNEINVLESEG